MWSGVKGRVTGLRPDSLRLHTSYGRYSIKKIERCRKKRKKERLHWLRGLVGAQG